MPPPAYRRAKRRNIRTSTTSSRQHPPTKYREVEAAEARAGAVKSGRYATA